MAILIAFTALITLSSRAAAFPSCLPRAKALQAKMTLEELRACQDKALLKFVRDARAQGRTPSDEEFDALDEFQRREARALLAVSDQPATSDSSIRPTLGGINPSDLSKVDADQAAALAALQQSLQEAAGDGSLGITPAMADQIRAVLLGQQGMLSPEMADLVDAVSRDGGKLTPATMKKLQDAGRAAKGAGLDLGIDPKIEKELLERDFSQDQTGPPPAM